MAQHGQKQKIQPAGWRQLAAFLLALLLAAAVGCGPAAPNVGTSNTPGLPSGSASQPHTPRAATPQSGEVSILLPTGMESLSRLLAEQAALDGVTVKVVQLAQGSQYVTEAAAMLQGDAPPDLYWVRGAQQAAPLIEEGLAADLSKERPVLAALAGMVPSASSLGAEGQVYGLPLGYYSQGYLVNLEVLSALLNAADPAILLRDLTACSFDQWLTLVETVQEYLQAPKRVQVRLGSNAYTMPTYRPLVAQPLRGMFAVPEADGSALARGALQTALNAADAGLADIQGAGGGQAATAWQNAGLEEQAACLTPAMGSLLFSFDFETLYMAGSEGRVWRGEDFANREKQDAAQATQQFMEGQALFLRSDSHQAIALTQADSMLADKLAMIPVKMPQPPAPPQPEEETEAEEGSGETQENGETADSQSQVDAREDADGSQQPEEGVPPAPDYHGAVSKKLEENNQKLLYAAEGYLCLNPNAQNPDAAETLLLRLFASQEGMESLLQSTQLVPFALAYSTTPLLAQVWQAAVGGTGVQATADTGSLDKHQATIGAELRDTLLDKTEWTEEDRAAFLAACNLAFGLPVQYNFEG